MRPLARLAALTSCSRPCRWSPRGGLWAEVDDHPSWCLQCGDPIPPHKRDDARFCSNRCRTAWHRREQSADDYAEAILIKYGGLPDVPPEASEERHVERAFLREAVNELRRRRLYWLRLETWLLHEPWMIWRNPAYLAWREQMQEQEHKKTRALMRSPYEENGSKFSTTARTLANKQAFLAQEYEDPEDRMLDEGKGGSK